MSSPSSSQQHNLRVQSEQSKFVQHLATYPALTALAGLIASFPVAKIFISNAVPLLHAIHERSKPISDPVIETATPYLRTLDSYGDEVLKKVDERFPNLKHMEPHNVYEDAHNYLDSIRSRSKSVYDEKVANPISHVAEAAHEQYTSIYNGNLKKGIAPLNDRIESVIDQLLPVENAVKETEQVVDNEFKRTYSLARRAAERAAPKIAQVYSNNLEQKSGSIENAGYIAKLLAVLATGKFISVEGYNHLLNHFGGSTKQLEDAVDDVKAKACEYKKEFNDLLE